MQAHRTVEDEMLRRPTVLSAEATVDDVRAFFDRDHVHLCLLVDGDRLVGTVTRGDLAGASTSVARATDIAVMDGRVVLPTEGAEATRNRMVTAGRRRLAVTDVNGRLVGLLCLKRSRLGFCSADDVAARAEDSPRRHGR